MFYRGVSQNLLISYKITIGDPLPPQKAKRQLKMTTYKLIYFNAKGRAELSRFIFAQAGVAYEDKRVEGAEWPKLKPNTPTGSLPVLEVDGKPLTGSGPIARFLAERFGLAGSNDFENAEIAGILDVLGDSFQKVVPYFFEKDEEKKAKMLKDILDEHIPKYWSIIEKKIECNKSDAGWIYGSKPTYADFAIFNSIEYVVAVDPGFLEKYPGVAKLKAAVGALPNIAKWLKERPKTEH